MKLSQARAAQNQAALQVVNHAKRQRSRGKGPSMSYKGESNPRKALQLALNDLGTKPQPKPRVVVVVVKKPKTMVILVWGHWQKVPAAAYGNTHFGRGNFRIKVCRDPKHEFKSLGKNRALIYNFS